LVGVAVAAMPRVAVNEAAAPATSAAEKVRLLITMRQLLYLLVIFLNRTLPALGECMEFTLP